MSLLAQGKGVPHVSPSLLAVARGQLLLLALQG